MRQVRADLSRLLAEGAGSRVPLLLKNATLPVAAVVGSSVQDLPQADDEGNVLADVLVARSCIARLCAPGQGDLAALAGASAIDLSRKMIWPCFSDPHSHLCKVHTCPRCPNPTGAINDALASEASDRPWSREDLERRMDFAIRAAYAHGVRTIRTHLDGCEDERADQRAAVWAAFDALRAKWAGRVNLQGVANLFLPCWSDASLAEPFVSEVVRRRPHVVLGAYCGCIRHRSALEHFRQLFRLARANELPVDLHVDETNAPDACGMPQALEALLEARRLGYDAPVLCGHCCAVSRMPAELAGETIALARDASGVVVVANPLTNLWLQDRAGQSEAVGAPIPPGPRTPQWRGLTLLKEFKAAGVTVALGGDNVRDWWFNYGDNDPLEAFRVGVLAGQLDKPQGALGDWATATTCVPMEAFGRPFCELAGDAGIGQGLKADLLIFGARRFSELLARPQADRVVLRSIVAADEPGQLWLVDPELPDYSELDDLVSKRTAVDADLRLPGR